MRGDASAQKTCKTCVKVRDEYFKCGYYYGEIYNCIRDDIRENCDKPTSACNACGECDAIMPEKLKHCITEAIHILEDNA